MVRSERLLFEAKKEESSPEALWFRRYIGFGGVFYRYKVLQNILRKLTTQRSVETE
jgi:hypothetical protein